MPPNGVLIRFHSTVRPTLPGFSVAPISATDSGSKNTSSGCSRGRRISCTESPPGFFSFFMCVSSSRVMNCLRRSATRRKLFELVPGAPAALVRTASESSAPYSNDPAPIEISTPSAQPPYSLLATPSRTSGVN